MRLLFVCLAAHWSLVDGPRESTPGYVKLLLPPRQSRGNSYFGLVDPADEGEEPSLLFLLTHEVKSGDGVVLSKRLQFVRVGADGKATFAGWAPHLDLEPLAETERVLLKNVLAAPWLSTDQESRAVALAAATLVPEHFSEVATRRIAHVDKTLAAVHERLTKEISFWSDRWMKLKDDQDAGKDVRRKRRHKLPLMPCSNVSTTTAANLGIGRIV